MSNLGPQQQNQSFSGLLQIPGGVTRELQQVHDGEGNTTGLWVSTTGATLNTADSFTISENGVTVPNAVPRLISDGFGDYVSVKDFGAVGNGTADDTTAIQNALNSASNNTHITFAVGGTYKTTSPLVIPETAINVVIKGNGATINCAHNGDGLVLNSINQNYSRHKVYDLHIIGPNVAYPNNPTELAGTSTGAGLKIGPNDTTNTCTAYMCSFINCRFENFKYGVYIQNALMCQFFGGNAFFNQYGVYIDGGQSNANNFNGFTIRENRVAGIYSSGRTGGSLSNATHNSFFGCEIETNIPYDSSAGGYPATFNSSGVGTGIYLLNSYGFVFDGCYMENHNYSVWIGNSSDQNQCINMRFAPGGAANVRTAGVAVKDSGTNNNIFQSCRMVSSDATTANVLIDNSGAINNQFLDCQGFNFITASLTGTPYIRNNIAYIGGGTPVGLINAPSFGGYDASAGSSARGNISGTTGSVTINAQGVTEVRIGPSAGLTGNITVTQFTNTVPLSFFAILLTQGTYSVTIQSGSMGGGGWITCKSGTNAVMSASGNYMLFWINALGLAVEVGRNF